MGMCVCIYCTFFVVKYLKSGIFTGFLVRVILCHLSYNDALITVCWNTETKTPLSRRSVLEHSYSCRMREKERPWKTKSVWFLTSPFQKQLNSEKPVNYEKWCRELFGFKQELEKKTRDMKVCFNCFSINGSEQNGESSLQICQSIFPSTQISKNR